MDILSQIKADQLQARRERNAPIAHLLGYAISQCETKSKSLTPTRSLTDDEVIGVINRILKQTGDALRMVGDRPEREEERKKLENERDALTRYLPAQLSEDELRTVVAQFAACNMNPTVGQIMSYLKENYAGKYDPRTASNIAKSCITNT